MKRYIGHLAAAVLVVAGLALRIIGIMKDLSFWNDENHVAIFARGILEHGRPVNDVGIGTGIYQYLMYWVTAVSFRLAGIHPWSARLPSVVAGTALIVGMYLIVRRIRNTPEALIVAALVSLSQIQLAWSTQARPYMWLTLSVALITYLCYRYLAEPLVTITDRRLLGSVVIALIATGFHATGAIGFILIGEAFLIRQFIDRTYTRLLWLIPVAIAAVIGVRAAFPVIFPLLFHFDGNIAHYRYFLYQNYRWLIAVAALGAGMLYARDRRLGILTVTFIVTIFAVAITKINSQYVRYSLPAFPLLYILFGAGLWGILRFLWVVTTSRVFNTVLAVTAFSLIMIRPVMRSKIILTPQYYYSINADIRENPIVDYRAAFTYISAAVKTHPGAAVMDAWNDRVPWYLPHQPFFYLNRDPKEQKGPIFGERMIGTIAQFDTYRHRYPAGIVLVENWESQTTPELQDYIRRNLKHAYDVNNLPYNDNDPWSISLYSWGM